MTTDLFTDEEHRARCTLLGEEWCYRKDRGYYVNVWGKSIRLKRLDALTLEPISDEEYKYRSSENKKEKWYG